MESEKPFAREDPNGTGDILVSDVRFKCPGSQLVIDAYLRAINAAHSQAVAKAVQEALKEVHFELSKASGCASDGRNWEQMLSALVSNMSVRAEHMRLEAVDRTWEEAARFIEIGLDSRICGPIKRMRIASALRSKKSTPEPREGEGR